MRVQQVRNLDMKFHIEHLGNHMNQHFVPNNQLKTKDITLVTTVQVAHCAESKEWQEFLFIRRDVEQMNSKLKNLLAFLTLMAMTCALSYGQAVSGDLVGLVVDKSGAVVPNATIEVTNEATNVKSTTTSNTSGEYRFSNLLVGTYDITATAKGFANRTLKGFVVELNKANNARLVMDVGSTETTVEVTATAPPVDTTTAQVQTTYDSRVASDLAPAAFGSGVLNLSLLQSGVGGSGGMGAGSGPSVGGQRPRNNNFMVEGVDNNDKGVTGPLVMVSNEAISNFTVLQNQFSPEFGHSTGGQFNTVITSGTNNFHGKVYEYFQNRDLNAIDTSNKNQGLTKNPRFDNNRFGGALGGPIFKDKLFFFGNYEYNPIGQAATPGSPLLAPTAAGFATLATIPGLSSTNVGVLKQFATAPAASGTLPVTSGSSTIPVQVGILPVVAPNFSNTKALATSMDWNISSKDQLRGRYIYNQISNIDTAAALPVFFQTQSTPDHLVAISEYHTFSPTITNELRLGFNRNAFNLTVPTKFSIPGLDAFPNLTIDNLGGLNIGPDPNAPQFGIQNYYGVTDNVTWIKGDHSFKFGIEGQKHISPQKFIQRSRGDYEWTTMDAFLHDVTPDFAERSFGSVGYSGDNYGINWFVNDTWKVRPTLSLNLGLRYEYLSTPFGWLQQSLNNLASVPGLITFGQPQAPKKDFMPRLGFAWSPGSSGTWSIRGGYSMGYDVLYDNIGVLSRPPQIGSTTDCPGDPSCPAGAFLGSGGIKNTGLSGITTLSVADARASTSTFLPNNIKYPYSESWNLGVQHSFGSYTAEMRYLGSRGIHLNVQNRINVQPIVTPTHFLPTYLTAPTQAQLDALPLTLTALNAQLNNGGNIVQSYAAAGLTNPIVAFLPLGSSNYNGLATQLNRRFSNGLQFQVAWTWSHTIDDSTADFFSTVLTPRRQQDFQKIAPERSNSALDRAHRFTAFVVYDVPWFKNANFFLKNVVGNFEITPVYTYETGEWANVQSAVDANLNGDNAGDRAIFNPNGVPGTGSDVKALKNSAGATVAYQAINPNAQYIRAQKGALANSTRNTLQMVPINNFDLSVWKRISFTERWKFEIGLQALNALNHAQYVGGTLNDIRSIGQSGSAAKNYLTPGATNSAGVPLFNNPGLTFPSNARSVQLAAKVIF
jgi:hypothetical protein